MPERQAISALVGVVSPLLTINSQDSTQLDLYSPFQPRDWQKAPAFVLEEVEAGPNNPPGLNQEIIWEIGKIATAYYDCVLRIIVPPVTIPNGVTAAYVDFLGFAWIQDFLILYGQNQNYRTRDYDLFLKYLYFLTDEKRFVIDDAVLGNKSFADRSAFLATGGTLYVPLYLPFSLDTTDATPIVSLSQKIRHCLTLKSLTQVTQQNPANSITAFNANTNIQVDLLCTLVHTTGDESDLFLQKALRDQGMSYMIHQPIIQSSDQIATLQTGSEQRIKLSNVTRAISWLTWQTIPVALTNNNGQNDIFMFKPNPIPVPPGMNSYNPFTRWQITANGLIIKRVGDTEYNRLYVKQTMFPSQCGAYSYLQSYSLVPTAPNAALGFMDYQNLNNATLIITTGTGGTGPSTANVNTPQSLLVIIVAWDYNFWIFQGGDWSRTFN
jgi:hypothetical protein